MNYQEHPTYGNETRDKSIIITFSKAPENKRQWESFHESCPQLDQHLKDLTYCDGSIGKNGLSNDWEKTDTTPRGLIGYVFENNKLTIWGTEAITPDYFSKAVQYIWSETTKTAAFAGADLQGFQAAGLPAKDVAEILKALGPVVIRCTRGSDKKPSPKP